MFGPGVCWNGSSLNRSGSFAPGGRLRSPYFADIFVRREALEGFESFGKVIRQKESLHVCFQMFVCFIIILFDSGIL